MYFNLHTAMDEVSVLPVSGTWEMECPDTLVQGKFFGILESCEIDA